MIRKIAVITGTRADYGILYYVLKAIEKRTELELQLIVCGMHLCPEFGMTIDEIRKDGFNIADSFETILASDSASAMVKTIGMTLQSIADSLNRLKPDMLLLIGDRGEMMAGAIAASHMNIACAHIHGGEVTGTIDESVRHAITKLSHIHFPATEDSKERIVKLGEKKENIFVTGAPGLDYIKKAEYMSRDQLLKKLGLKDEAFIMLTQHPVTTEREQVAYQIEETMEAVVKFGLQTIVSYPNSDNGGREIIACIEDYKNRYDIFKVYKNLSQTDYLNILNNAAVMVGNSSSGIIEAASYKLPVVNIGTRQQGRLRSGNIIDVGYGRTEIVDGIKKALYDEKFKSNLAICNNVYGNGESGEKIAEILTTIKIDRNLLQKKITY